MRELRVVGATMAALVCLAAGAHAQDAKPIPLKVGTLKQGSLTNVWVAKQAGIFDRDGLDVELIEFRNGNEAIAAQRSGAVDIVLTIPGTAMAAVQRGFDLMLISGNETSQPSTPDTGSIVVRKDSGINSLADLKGKTIAISGTHTQKTVDIQAILKKAGVGPTDFQFMEMPYTSQVDALRSKQIEVAASLDPWTTLFRNSDFAKILAYDYYESLPEQPIGGWYARKDFVSRNGEATKRFAKAMCDVADYMQADLPRARKNIADYTGLKPDLVEQVPVNHWTCKVDLKIWQRVADMMHEGGELQKPFDVTSWFADSVKPYVVK
jgi:NitT/TauT family transport system substrate-binding protein